MSIDQMTFYQQKLAYETDSWDLHVALHAEDSDVVVVDGRSSDAYEKEHIPGALSVPHRTISSESLAGLDRSKLYVTYCDGIGCNASTKTAMKMLALGFRVKELIGGLDWWKRDGHPTTVTLSHADDHVIACGCDG